MKKEKAYCKKKKTLLSFDSNIPKVLNNAIGTADTIAFLVIFNPKIEIRRLICCFSY